MRARPPFALLAISSGLLLWTARLSAQEPAEKRDTEPAAAARAKSPQVIKEWGQVTNPAGDCKVETDKGKLVITVPAESRKAHGYSAELGNMDAPRVLQEVKGDFDLQVKVDGTFAPGQEHGEGSRLPYQGAGLTVMADGSNYIRIERAVMLYGEIRHYINFEIRVDGELQRFGSNEPFPLDETKPVWLRLERREDMMRGGMSHDGKEWTWGEAKELTAKAWEAKSIQAGVHAISSSMEEFAPVFADLVCGEPGAAEKPKTKAEEPAKEKQP